MTETLLTVRADTTPRGFAHGAAVEALKEEVITLRAKAAKSESNTKASHNAKLAAKDRRIEVRFCHSYTRNQQLYCFDQTFDLYVA